jgi:uncharacterized protein with PIN domain
MHPQLAIEVAAIVHQERQARALAERLAGSAISRGSTPRVALATALVALAARIAPGTADRRADATA